jgi:hypothetical protein
MDLLLDTIEAAADVAAAERALLLQGRKVGGWNEPGGGRTAHIPLLPSALAPLHSFAFVEYRTFDDGYVTINKVSCSIRGT